MLTILRIGTLLTALTGGLAQGQDTAPVPPLPRPAQPPEYDPALFQMRMPADQLLFLNQFSGTPAGSVYRDKQFHKLSKIFVPGCLFHYGRDMPLSDALDMVFNDSPVPVVVRDGRYVSLVSHNGPYLRGHGFLWIDLQEGIGLGGFYFQPTNGEPTPTLSVFSKQVKGEQSLQMSQLPAEFAADLTQWSFASRLPQITTRYFLSGSNKRILLEHSEDYCNPPAGDPCDQMNADAADMDMNAAYYLDQVNYATNATAWMISPDQVAWIAVRNNTCGAGPNPLLCHIRMTRERTRLIVNRRPRHI